METLTRAEVNDLIRQKQGERSLRAFSKSLKLSVAYLSDVLRNNREPGPGILRHFGLKRVKETSVTYVRVGRRR
jgi:hypothetical protein